MSFFFPKISNAFRKAFVTDDSKHFFDLYVSYNNVQNNPVCDKGSGSLLAFFGKYALTNAPVDHSKDFLESLFRRTLIFFLYELSL